MTTFTSPFTGDIVEPTDVSYYALSFSADVELAWPTYQAPGSTAVAAARIMDCTPSTSGLNITLPPASQGSVGSDILFRNLGSSSFTITDYSGTQSATLAAGQARYFYLVDDSDVTGSWHNFTYGTGTSSADAASLQGAGLTTLSGKLATTNNIVQYSAPFTLNDASRAITYVWTGGLQSITLPSMADISGGWYFMVRNNGTGALTFNSAGVEEINGQTSVTLNPGDSGIIVADKNGGNFYTVGLASPTNVSFTSATYDVDSIIGNSFSLVSYAPMIQTYVALAGTRTATLNVTLPAITQLYVFSNNTNNSTYNITFQVSGSSQTPIVFSSGTVAIVLSDGANLYILTQVGQGYYFADDGTVATPSFSFLNDTSTGLYLPSIHQLGIVANSIEMINVDASNTADLQISTPAQFNAALISGGTF